MHCFSLLLKLAALAGAQCLAPQSICRARDSMPDPAARGPVLRLTSVWHNFAVKDRCGCVEQLLGADDDPRNSGLCQYRGFCIARAAGEDDQNNANIKNICDALDLEDFQSTIMSHNFTAMHFCDFSPNNLPHDIKCQDLIDHASTIIRMSNLPVTEQICVPPFSGLKTGDYNISGGYMDLAMGNRNAKLQDCENCYKTDLHNYNYDAETGMSTSPQYDKCLKTAYSFSISDQVQENSQDCALQQNQTQNQGLPLNYVAYNPIIPAARSWSCGFAEVLNTTVAGHFGKICGKNKRATGRLIASMTCPQLSGNFDQIIHKVSSFFATKKPEQNFEHTFEDYLGHFHPSILNADSFDNYRMPDEEFKHWNTFAEWNRVLLSRDVDWWKWNPETEKHNIFWEHSSFVGANSNTRRTPVAHAFAMWEGKGRVVQDGLPGSLQNATREWVDNFYGTHTGSGGADPKPRTNASNEDRLVAWIDVDCVEAVPVFHDVREEWPLDWSDATEYPASSFWPLSDEQKLLVRLPLYRRVGEACYRRNADDWDWGGCVVYDWTQDGCIEPVDKYHLRDVEDCVAQDSNERIEVMFLYMHARNVVVVPKPHADRFNDFCNKTELDYSGNTPDPRTYECLEKNNMTYLAVCCQGVQATPDDASSAPRPTMRNFYPPSELTHKNAAMKSFDVLIPPFSHATLQLKTIHDSFVAIVVEAGHTPPDNTWNHFSDANVSDLLHMVDVSPAVLLREYSKLAKCSCDITEVIDYVPVVVAQSTSRTIHSHPDDDAICATFTHFANCTDHCTLCASRCKFFCADDFFGNGELDAPFLLFDNRTRFVRTCRPHNEVCTADRLPPLLPEHHTVVPPPSLSVHDLGVASLVARDPPAEGWAYALRSSDAGHTHDSMQCPVTEDCKHKVHVYALPTQYIPGRFYSVLRATGVRLQSPSHVFSELDALTHQRCEKKCWDLGLHACTWFAVAPGSACYLGDGNISHALRADMPLCHGADCAPFLAHMDSRYVAIDTKAQEFRVYGMAAYLAHTHRVPTVAQNREGLREVQALSLDAHDCAALCAHDLRCTRFAAWGPGMCAVDGPGEGNFTDVPGGVQVTQVGLGDVDTVEICIDGELEATYQHFYVNDSVLSCAQNAAREPMAQTCQECPADQNAEWPWCGDFFFALCDRCIACPDGQIRPVAEEECRYCTRREFYDIATGKCVECLPHHRRSDASPFRCEPCALGDQACKRCPAGTARDLRYAQGGASTLGEVCVPCPDDAVEENTTACACAPGWMLDEAQGVCVACPPGTAKAQYGDDKCEVCLPGTAAPGRGAARCAQCLRDRGPGITSTVQCLPVVFAQNAEEECAEDAGKVRWSLENGQGFVCLPQAVAEMQEVPCREGFEGVEVMPSAHVCLPCGLGWFRGNATVECVPCRQVGVNYSRTTCEESEACLHWATVGDAVAGLAARWDLVPQVEQGSRDVAEVVCGDGHVRDQEHNVCVRCAEGFEANGEACVPCGPGNWTVQGLTGCRPCPGNMTSRMPEGCVCREGEAPGQGGQCVKCARGFFKAVAGNGSCLECLWESEVTFGEGAVSCAECPEYAKPLRNTSRCVCGPGLVMGVGGVCEKCAQGKVSAGFDDVEECEDCAAGTFEQGRINCLECVPGTFSTETGQTTCEACPAGKVQGNSTSLALCEDCPPGTYYVSTTECRECGLGSFNNETAQFACNFCMPGTFANSTGSLECMLCESGKFENRSKSTQCRLCGIGTYQNQRGQTLCLNCSPGKYQNQRGQTLCLNCSPGKYQNQRGQTLCLDCSPGKYQESIAQSDCIDCAPGYYTEISRATSCNTCQQGKYAQESGSLTCTSCQENLLTRAIAATSSDMCVCSPGNYFDTSRCIQCPGESIQPTWGIPTSCSPCEKNQYAQSGKTSCKTCYRCWEEGRNGACYPYKEAQHVCYNYNTEIQDFQLCESPYITKKGQGQAVDFCCAERIDESDWSIKCLT